MGDKVQIDFEDLVFDQPLEGKDVLKDEGREGEYNDEFCSIPMHALSEIVLSIALSRKNILVTGMPGAGKTTLCKYLIDRTHKDNVSSIISCIDMDNYGSIQMTNRGEPEWLINVQAIKKLLLKTTGNIFFGTSDNKHEIIKTISPVIIIVLAPAFQACKEIFTARSISEINPFVDSWKTMAVLSRQDYNIACKTERNSFNAYIQRVPILSLTFAYDKHLKTSGGRA